MAALEPAPEVTYTPISSADAVILYARNFVPSWAGAIAIDLLPAVLVLILAITHGMIRTMRDGTDIEDTMTVAELRAAIAVAHEIEDTPAPRKPGRDADDRDDDGKVKRITGTTP